MARKMKIMVKIRIEYQSGESVEGSYAVDYMFAVADVGGEEVELYAEAENPTWDEDKDEYGDETATYRELKASILEQAAKVGIPAENLSFMYG